MNLFVRSLARYYGGYFWIQMKDMVSYVLEKT